jgi:beta-lactamase superfamily II metal-dependent hydrolase
LLESEDVTGAHYALIDSNDTSTLRSSYIFLKRFFEKRAIAFPSRSPVFEWVLLTHRDADHGQGLKKILRDFGTGRFLYSDSANQPTFFADLVRYAAKSSRVRQYDVVDTSKILPSFGAASMQALWLLPGATSANENDNSVVLAITLGQVVFVLSGDAEGDGVWTHVAIQLPD